MAEEQLRAFLLKLAGDSDLTEKIKAAASQDDVLSIARAAGFEITKMDLLNSASRHLSEGELKEVAGGKGVSQRFRGFGGKVKNSKAVKLSKNEWEASKGPVSLPCELHTIGGTVLATCSWSTSPCEC